VLNQAVRNLNDGISYLSIADSALDQAGSILVRIEELAIQSANGAYSDAQRSALQLEAQALRNEYSRIIESTSFNGINIFTSDQEETNLHVGLTSGDLLNIEFRKVSHHAVGTGSYSASSAIAFNSTSGSTFAYDLLALDVDGD